MCFRKYVLAGCRVQICTKSSHVPMGEGCTGQLLHCDPHLVSEIRVFNNTNTLECKMFSEVPKGQR